MFRSALVCVLVFTSFAYASPAKKPLSIDGMVEEMRSSCSEDEPLACMKLKVMNFLDNILRKENYKLSEDVEVRSNGYAPLYEQRSGKDVFETVSDYVQSHDVTVNLPAADAKVTISPKAISEGEFNVNVKFADESRSVDGRGKKHKLRKLLVPIFVFILLKAMTLVPLALGVLGLKAWNALQLSFFSFIISFALAIFQLCKKLAVDNHTPQIVPAHGPWEHAGRSLISEFLPSEPLEDETQELAYNAYA